MNRAHSKNKGTEGLALVVSTVALAAPVDAQPSGSSLPSAPDATAACPDVQVVFARGTAELPGLGLVGTPFASRLTAALPGQSVATYAVDYRASFDQSSAGPGGTDMTRTVIEIAARCVDTKFVLGGYSQGASATAASLGVPTRFGAGEVIPEELAPRIAAVVTFGDPLQSRGQSIEDESALYGDRARAYCTVGDPVCGPGQNFLAHLAYPLNSTMPEAVKFAASKVLV